MNPKIKRIEEYAEKLMKVDKVHDFSHVDRVKNWALQIAEKENFNNLELLEATVLLHDIGYNFKEKDREHGEIGAQKAREYLKENNLYTDSEIDEICEAIKWHNKNRGGNGELLNILRDADMLDLFGAIGILRCVNSRVGLELYDINNPKGETWNMGAKDFDQRFDSGQGIGQYVIDQINFQISCYDNLSTKSARELAEPFVEFARKFVLEIEVEINKCKEG